MRNYFTYFTEIEEYFVRKRGRNLLVSPLDWCLIEVWKDHGIPLHIAMRGIDRSFEAAEKRHKRPPKTLFYCHPAVMEAYEQYREAMVGREEDSDEAAEQNPISKDQVSAHLLKVMQQLQETRENQSIRRALNQLSAIQGEISERKDLNLRDIDQALNRTGRALAEQLLEEMDSEEAKNLRKEVRKEVRIYKKRLAPETFERLQQNYLHRRVREYFDLPEFSLLELQ